MNEVKILSKQEKKEIEDKLEEQFGIKKIPGLIIKKGKERLFLFSGDMSEKQIKELESITFLERIGIYFARIIKVNEGGKIKLSIEGAQLLKSQIKKNIFELNKNQLIQWMHGQELNIKTGKKGFLIMRHEKDFLGCGKASENKISNFIPKSRRLKEKIEKIQNVK